MANQQYPYDIPSNYTFDSEKIEVTGGLVSLKESSLWIGLQSYWKMNEGSWNGTVDEVIDSSDNNRHGTAQNGATTTINGKLDRAGIFDGNNDKIIMNDYSFASGDFSIVAWIKTTDVGNYRIIFASSINGAWNYPLWFVRKDTSDKFQFGCATSVGNTINLSSTASINDDNYHLVVAVRENDTMKISVDNSTFITTTFTGSLATAVENVIAERFGGTTTAWNGNLDEIGIWSRSITQAEIQFIYNSGAGKNLTRYPIDKPTIEPTILFDPAIVSSWDSFLQTLGGGNQGAIGYNLYKVDKVNKYYWNGSVWVTGGSGDNYNSVAIINTNIGSFDVSPDKIGFIAYLISNGDQIVEIDSNEITYTTNQLPNVNAGSNKQVKDNQYLALFSDCTFSDPDGSVTNAYYKIDGEIDIWTEILIGGYATLLEAVQAFQYQFNNPGILISRLKVRDNISGESEDSLQIDVQKYQVTFNIKDIDGNDLALIMSNFDDGQGWQQKNSPFTYEFNYNASNYICTFDKTGFVSQSVNVSSTDHIENITMQKLTVDPSAIADAVWDELRVGHTNSGTAGETITILNAMAGGRYEIISNQLVIYDSDNATEIMRFNLFDKNGNSTMSNIYKRTRI